MLENKRQYVMDEKTTGGAREERDISPIKINALKELMLALLDEVERLKDSRQLDGIRSVDFNEEVRHFEVELIRWALMRTGGHQRRAARLLNVKVTTLNAKIKRYGIRPANLPVSNVVDIHTEGRSGIS